MKGKIARFVLLCSFLAGIRHSISRWRYFMTLFPSYTVVIFGVMYKDNVNLPWYQGSDNDRYYLNKKFVAITTMRNLSRVREYLAKRLNHEVQLSKPPAGFRVLVMSYGPPVYINELIEKTWQSNAFGNCRPLTDRRIQSLVTTAMLQAIDELPKPACPRFFH